MFSICVKSTTVYQFLLRICIDAIPYKTQALYDKSGTL